MRSKFYSPQKLKKDIMSIISRHLDFNAYRVFFFGSRVAGKGNERSDIDIGIEGQREIPYEVMGKIREEIEELPTLYKIEIVDFKKISSDFKKVALEYIEVIS